MSEHEIQPGEKEEATLTNWRNAPSLKDLKQDLQDAQPYHDSQKTKISGWLDNLNVEGQAKVNTPKGRSKHVPKLIRKQAEWRYSALSEPFLSAPDLFDTSPVTWEDRKAAQQNKLVLNHQFNNQIDRVEFIDEYVRTAVDEGTVIVRVGWEFEEDEVEEEVPVVSFEPDPQMVPIHQQLAQLQAESPSQYMTDVPKEMQQAHELSMEQGVPFRPIVTGYEIHKVLKTIRNAPTLEVCDYRNVVIDPSCKGNLDKAGFIIHSFESSLSELKKTKLYKNLDKINISNSSILSEPDHSSSTPDNFNFSDEPRKKIVVYEYWGFWDIDGTGVVQPIVAAWVGNTVIRMEVSPFPDKKLPFVKVSYLPVRRSSYGEPDGALLEDNQKIVGAVTRGMLDILGRTANGQTGMRKDMLDATNRRKFDRGLDYEFNQNVDPRQGVYTHTFPEIPNSASLMLQLQHADAESLTGVKAFTSGITGASLGETATGVRGALDAASKRELGILRRLANGIVRIGRKIIAMNAEFLAEEEIVRVTNDEFVTVKRDDLAGTIDLKLSVSTAEEDDAKAQELAFMIQTLGSVVDRGTLNILLAENARLRKMPDVAKRILDYKPEPDPMEQEKHALEMELLRAQIEETRAQAMERQANAQLDSVKAGNVQSDTDLKNLDFVEQESGVKQERELQKHGAQAQSNMQLKVLENRLKESSNAKSTA